MIEAEQLHARILSRLDMTRDMAVSYTHLDVYKRQE